MFLDHYALDLAGFLQLLYLGADPSLQPLRDERNLVEVETAPRWDHLFRCGWRHTFRQVAIKDGQKVLKRRPLHLDHWYAHEWWTIAADQKALGFLVAKHLSDQFDRDSLGDFNRLLCHVASSEIHGSLNSLEDALVNVNLSLFFKLPFGFPEEFACKSPLPRPVVSAPYNERVGRATGWASVLVHAVRVNDMLRCPVLWVATDILGIEVADLLSWHLLT